MRVTADHPQNCVQKISAGTWPQNAKWPYLKFRLGQYIPPHPRPPQRGPQGLINLHLLQATANGNCSTSCTLYNIFNFSHTRLVHDIMPDHLWNLKCFTC